VTVSLAIMNTTNYTAMLEQLIQKKSAKSKSQEELAKESLESDLDPVDTAIEADKESKNLGPIDTPAEAKRASKNPGPIDTDAEIKEHSDDSPHP
jgi:hypothetical protein